MKGQQQQLCDAQRSTRRGRRLRLLSPLPFSIKTAHPPIIHRHQEGRLVRGDQFFVLVPIWAVPGARTTLPRAPIPRTPHASQPQLGGRLFVRRASHNEMAIKLIACAKHNIGFGFGICSQTKEVRLRGVLLPLYGTSPLFQNFPSSAKVPKSPGT